MNPTRIRRSAVGIVGIGIATAIAPVILATPALAAAPTVTITSVNGVLAVDGTTGPDTIIASGTRTSVLLEITPESLAVTMPANCSAVPDDANDAICTGPFTNLEINGADGDDVLTNGVIRLAAELRGAGGNDTLVGGDLADNLSGGTGSDDLQGKGGNDILAGGLNIGLEPDADRFVGGSGIDTADYVDHRPGAVATRDNLANDGTPGEGDNVMDDVERFVGAITVLS